jgi:hypothetical protein
MRRRFRTAAPGRGLSQTGLDRSSNGLKWSSNGRERSRTSSGWTRPTASDSRPSQDGRGTVRDGCVPIQVDRTRPRTDAYTVDVLSNESARLAAGRDRAPPERGGSRKASRRTPPVCTRTLPTENAGVREKNARARRRRTSYRRTRVSVRGQAYRHRGHTFLHARFTIAYVCCRRCPIFCTGLLPLERRGRGEMFLGAGGDIGRETMRLERRPSACTVHGSE